MPKNNPAAYGDMNKLLDQLISSGYFDPSSENGVGAMKFAEGEFAGRGAKTVPQGATPGSGQAPSRDGAAPTPPRRPSDLNTGSRMTEAQIAESAAKQLAAFRANNGLVYSPTGDPGLYAEGPRNIGSMQDIPATAIANSGMRVGPASANASQALPDGTPLPDPTAAASGSIRSLIQSIFRELAAQSPMPPQMQGEGKLIDAEQIIGNVPITREDDVAQRNLVSRNMQAEIDAKARARGMTPPPASAPYADQIRYNMRVMNSNSLGNPDTKPSKNTKTNKTEKPGEGYTTGGRF